MGSVKKKKKNSNKYEPVTEVSINSAMAQSAYLLNLASENAVGEKDLDKLLACAEKWMEQAAVMTSIVVQTSDGEGPVHYDLETEKTLQTGFTGSTREDVEE